MSFLPGWNSAETTAWLHDLFEIAGIVFLALLVITEVLAVICQIGVPRLTHSFAAH